MIKKLNPINIVTSLIAAGIMLLSVTSSAIASSARENGQSNLNSSYLLVDTNTPTNTPLPPTATFTKTPTSTSTATATRTSTLTRTATATRTNTAIPNVDIRTASFGVGGSPYVSNTGSTFTCIPAVPSNSSNTIICTGHISGNDANGVISGNVNFTLWGYTTPFSTYYWYMTVSNVVNATPFYRLANSSGPLTTAIGSGSTNHTGGIGINVMLGTTAAFTGDFSGDFQVILSSLPISATSTPTATFTSTATPTATPTATLVPGTYFNPLTDVYSRSVAYSGGRMSTMGGALESDGSFSVASCSQSSCGDPVNPRTGVFSFGLSDISFPTSAGDLIFQRSYSSGTAQDEGVLGYGWTHNHGAELIFPSDPGGMAGYVLFQSPLGNRYLFKILTNGGFEPGPGVLAELSQSASEYTLTASDQDVFTFDLNGRLLSRVDALGNEISYTYNAQSRLSEISADAGTRTLQIGYDAQGRISSVTNHANQQVGYGYDSNGDLVSFTDLLNQTWTYTYNSAHQMTQMHDPSGALIVINQYDPQGRVTDQHDGEGKLLVSIEYLIDGSSEVTDALGNVTLYEYDTRGVTTDITDDLGYPETKVLDANFRPTILADEVGDITTLTWSTDGKNLTQIINAEGEQTDITYNALDLPVSISDSNGNDTTFIYDGTLLTSTTNALNQTTTYTYNAQDQLISVTDPLDHTTSYTYNSHGQRISMTDPMNHTWTYSYDSLGRLIDTTDPLLHVTHNVYDAAGRLTSVTRNYDENKDQNEDNEWNIVTSYGYDVRWNQTSVMDTLGRTTYYEYDDAGLLIKTIDPDGNETINTYNNAGQLITVTDALGRATHYTYDDVGRLITTTDELNHTTRTTYNPDGTVASTTDALNRTTSYEYDSLKRVITTNLPNGGQTHNTYDELGNLATTSDALGKVTTYQYDELNRLVKTIDPLTHFTETVYDAAGRVIQTKDARGHTTTYGYDAAGRQISVTDALQNVTTYGYDALGRRISVIDANENETSYVYDELSRTVSVTDALEHTSTTTYDALGQTLVRTDPNNNSVSFAYNELNQLISQTDALSNVTSFTYDDVGNRLTVTDANLHTTTTGYDVLNRPITFIDANNHTSSSTYDAVGNLLTSSDALGNDTTYSYTDLNQPHIITDALQHETRNLYNARGDLILTTDAEGVVTKYEYDDLARLITVIENYQAGIPADAQTNVRTEYTYDENGNRLSILDANGHVTTFTYDELNRLIAEKDPLDHIWETAYDDVGNRISTTDANGAITHYGYDDANRLITIDYPSGADVTFTYDNGGRRISMTDGLGTTTWTYNAINQVIAVTDPFNKTVEYAYDDAGNKIEIIYPDDSTVSYTYDDANRLITVDGLSSIVEYTYDNANRLTLMSRPDDIDTAFTYDDANRVLSITHVKGIELLSSFGYTYDDVGNRIQAIENVKSPELPAVPTNSPTGTMSPVSSPTDTMTPTATQADTSTPTVVTSPTDTLTPISSPTGTETLIASITPSVTETLEFTLTPSETPEFTYTPSETSIPTETSTPMNTATATEAQIPTETMTPSETATLLSTFTLTETLTPSLTWTPTATNTPIPFSGPVTIDYEYDSLYRLTSAEYATGEFYHYTYDKVGNRLTEGTHLESHSYAYDIANRLTSVDSVSYTYDNNGNLLNDGTNAYAYDPANRLTSVNSTTTYTYNGLGDRYQQTVDSQVTTYVLDLNAGLTQVLEEDDTSYLYGLGRIAQSGTTAEYFLSDTLGSVRQLVAGGEIVLAKSYTPYGEDLYSTGSGESAFAYTGEQTDPNGLVYLRARYYNSADGRFMSRDTWGGIPNHSLSMNRWNYTQSNPINYTDPSGFCGTSGEPPCPTETLTPTPPTPPTTPSTPSYESILERLKYLGGACTSTPTPLPPMYEQGNGFWMVIKYSTYSKWKSYSTTNTTYGAKAVFGVGAGAGYTCETSTGKCALTFGIKAGSAKFSVGLGSEYNFADESFEMGATVDVGPCDVFLNYAKISFTCKALDFGNFGEKIEFGWKRNPYEAYWVLVHTSQINAAGGEDEFGKRLLVSRVYRDLDLNYSIMDSDTDKSALRIRFFNIHQGIPLIQY